MAKEKLTRKEAEEASNEYAKRKIVDLNNVSEDTLPPEISWFDYYTDVANAFMAGVVWKEKNK